MISGIDQSCVTELDKESFVPSRIPVTLRFVPGSEIVSGINMKIKTIGNFTLCFRGLIVNAVNKFLYFSLLVPRFRGNN